MGQDVGRNPRNRLEQLVEAPGPVHEGVDEEQRPAVADPLQGRSQGRDVVHIPIVEQALAILGCE